MNVVFKWRVEAGSSVNVVFKWRVDSSVTKVLQFVEISELRC